MRTVRKVIGELSFAEGPRWRDGALYISEMHSNRVLRWVEGREPQIVAEIDDATSGLGWLPDGRMLVAAMHSRKIMRQEHDGSMVVHADLNGIATFHVNDMVVGPDGTAYVGNFGFSIFPFGDPRPAVLARVAPDGTASPAADNLWFPNGIALTGDGKMLIVAESGGYCLTAFDIEADGSLINRRIWAALGEGKAPDGLCLDVEGHAWVALPHQSQFVRVREGGTVTETIGVEGHALACCLGGQSQRTLFMMTSHDTEPEKAVTNRSASVFATEVDIPGAGWP